VIEYFISDCNGSHSLYVFFRYSVCFHFLFVSYVRVCKSVRGKYSFALF
jgi:hypothetical protein